MGVVFWLFSYFTTVLVIVILALSIGSFLYILTELTEEFPTITGRILSYMLIGISILQAVLWLDGLGTKETFLSFLSYGCYYLMLKDFPWLNLTSFATISSILCFLLTNVVWLRYFIIQKHIDPISTIGFFITNVWFIPCGLFISLSINENVLPGMIGSQYSTDNGLSNLATTGGGRKKSAFRTVYDLIYNQINQVLGVLNPMKLLQDKKK
jgi:hypothetical protein